jgi:hypothetical protein
VKETRVSCPYCKYTTKYLTTFNRHLSYRHDIGVQWNQCEYCDDKFKQKGDLKQHMAYVHNIGVTWEHCKYCDDKFKQKGHLKQHMAYKHDINVTWYKCGKCDFKSKKTGTLNRHIARVHDIGHKECTVCYKQCGILKQFKGVGICRECAVAYGAKKERIEIKYVNALKKQFDMPFVHDARVGGNACLSYRPDVLFLDANCKVHIQFELDEHQHGWKSGSYDCDEKRISDIYDEFGDNVPDHYVVVRLNPDSYGNEQHCRNKVFKKRFDHLLEVLHAVRKRPPPHRISTIYMYYDENNHRIAKNIPTYMLNDTVRLF